LLDLVRGVEVELADRAYPRGVAVTAGFAAKRLRRLEN
jgi:hypothetical protein